LVLVLKYVIGGVGNLGNGEKKLIKLKGVF
jgi:hypothetical protein